MREMAFVRAVGWLLLSVAILALDWFFPVEGAYATPSGAVWQGWVNSGVARLFPVVFVVLASVSVFSWWRLGVLLADGRTGESKSRFWLEGLCPLAFLPLLVAIRHGAAWIGVTLAAMAIPIGIPLLLMLCAERLTRPFFESAGRDRPCPKAPLPWRVFGLAFLSLAAIYFWQGKDRFIGGGDVCHYMAQTENLVAHGDLDLSNRMEREMRDADLAPEEEEEYLRYSHMRRNDKGRIYSVHAFGWPLLAWPFARVAGTAGIDFFSMLVAAWALVGVFASCLRCGASTPASVTATVAVGLSWFWNYTALSRLPEMLGCALCIWAFWASVAKADSGRRVVSAALATLCCACLPVAHMRFFPLAAVLYIGFLFSPSPREESPSRKRGRLSLTLASVALVLLSWALLWRSHRAMFSGVSSFSMSDIFMSHPTGIPGIFTNRRGAGPIFPLIWIFALAPVSVFRQRDRNVRAAGGIALAAEIVTLVSCCANPGTLEGACISARYYLQAIPPLIPFGARYLDQCGRSGRRWWFFLASMPILYLLFVSPHCSGGGLIHSPYGLWEFDAFRSFWMPLRNGYDPLPLGRAAASAVLPAVLMAVPWLLATRKPSRLACAAFFLLLSTGLAFGLASTRFLPPVDNCPANAFGQKHNWHSFRQIAGPKSASYAEMFNSTRGFPHAAIVISDHVQDKEGERGATFIRTRDIPQNDWAGRDIHWATLRKIVAKHAHKGAMAIHVAGEVVDGELLIGSALTHWILVPDDMAFGKGEFDLFLLVPHFNELIPVYAALRGNAGTARIDVLDVLPWAPELGQAVGPFPSGTVVVDALPEANRRRR